MAEYLRLSLRKRWVEVVKYRSWRVLYQGLFRVRSWRIDSERGALNGTGGMCEPGGGAAKKKARYGKTGL